MDGLALFYPKVVILARFSWRTSFLAQFSHSTPDFHGGLMTEHDLHTKEMRSADYWQDLLHRFLLHHKFNSQHGESHRASASAEDYS